MENKNQKKGNYKKVKNNDVTKLSGLEALLFEFSFILHDDEIDNFTDMDDNDNRYIYYNEKENSYNYIDKNIVSGEYTIADIENFVKDRRLYKEYAQFKPVLGFEDYQATYYHRNLLLGLYLSAAINRVIKKGETVHINSKIILNSLFYRLKDAEGYVDKAGYKLGCHAENSKIYAKEAKGFAGAHMKNSELHVDRCGDKVGFLSENSKIYAKEARRNAGWFVKNSELYLGKTAEMLGYSAINSKFYVKSYFGHGGSEYFVTMNHAGHAMKNSSLYIEDLDGGICYPAIKYNNIYIGKEFFEKHKIRGPLYKRMGVNTLENEIAPDSQDSDKQS
ncbi:hypothetical protein M1558_00425 [Candidatus Parvarchaeota archaeon]|nr:hypothetical protein [Candidatus Parvarchaeota archaeon]